MFVCFKGRNDLCLTKRIRICRVPRGTNETRCYVLTFSKAKNSLHTARVYQKPRPIGFQYFIQRYLINQSTQYFIYIMSCSYSVEISKYRLPLLFREQVMKNMICQQLKKYSGEVNLLGDNHKTFFFFKKKLLQVLNAPSLYVHICSLESWLYS